MARFAEHHSGIDPKKSAAAGYSSLWRRMLSEWQHPGESDRAWLLYSANYLLRTAGVRWALDPLTLRQRLPAAPDVDASLLSPLAYIILTHHHYDHLDPGLLRRLRTFPIHWIVPEFLLEHLKTFDLPPESVTIPRPLEPLHLGALTLTPFEGLHSVADASRPFGRRGVPALGYLAEFNGKRWLFPGDTRIYNAAGLPSFGSIDGLYAHLWLGRGSALEADPAYLPDFCRFCLDLKPKRIILTHLDELGRPPKEIWTIRHAALIIDWFATRAPGVLVEAKIMGESIGM